MTRVPLVGPSYAGKDLIASGQECVNLYAEANNDPDAPVPVTYYPTAGTAIYADPNFGKPVRGTYRTSIGTAYAVIGQNLYFVTEVGTLVFIGAIADRQSQIYFSDNGLVLVFVDGVNGYVVDLISNAFGIITDPNFYGADYVTLLDTFFCFNRPLTNQFYITGSNVNFALLTTTGAFDPLDIAAKSGFNDPIVGIVAVHAELWLIGNLTSEIWIGTGAADFYFQRVQGAYVNHGCAAQYSIATMDVLVFFIMQDQQGNGIVVQGQGYDVTEISTPRIVSEFKSYFTLEDAIGFTFQYEDHAFYALVFPTANKGWLYDVTSSNKMGIPMWSEWNYCDANGNLIRPRANCCMFFNDLNIVGDYQNGQLLVLNPNVYQDVGQPIVRIKTFPHHLDDNNKVTYNSFDADMTPGTDTDQNDDPNVSLSWSDDKGKTYGNPVMQSMGKTGKYLTVISWNRLGQARDRVFKLQWSTNNDTALNGGFVERKVASK